jgi:hypothetical protein
MRHEATLHDLYQLDRQQVLADFSAYEEGRRILNRGKMAYESETAIDRGSDYVSRRIDGMLIASGCLDASI